MKNTDFNDRLFKTLKDPTASRYCSYRNDAGLHYMSFDDISHVVRTDPS